MLEGARNLQSVLGVGLCVKKCKKWIFWGLGLARGGKVLDLSSHAKARRKRVFIFSALGLFVMDQIRTLRDEL
jgi:hypothetical protein